MLAEHVRTSGRLDFIVLLKDLLGRAWTIRRFTNFTVRGQIFHDMSPKASPSLDQSYRSWIDPELPQVLTSRTDHGKRSNILPPALIHGLSWISMESHELFSDIHESSLFISMAHPWIISFLPWTSMVIHWNPWLFALSCRVSQIPPPPSMSCP